MLEGEGDLRHIHSAGHGVCSVGAVFRSMQWPIPLNKVLNGSQTWIEYTNDCCNVCIYCLVIFLSWWVFT